MTYTELEQRVKSLESLIDEALVAGNCTNDWAERARQLLRPPAPASKDIFTGKRWEGERCGCCGHSSVFHARGGICTRANCDCLKFQSSGKAVDSNW